jgi:hypothetical protein
MALVPIVLGLASFAVPSLFIAARAVSISSPAAMGREPSQRVMTSPWWENYDIKERFLCTEKGEVALERNASQAALISGHTRTTLFREASEAPGLIYRNDDLRVMLRGDELTVERFPVKITCLRSEEV